MFVTLPYRLLTSILFLCRSALFTLDELIANARPQQVTSNQRIKTQHGNVRHFQLGMMYFLYAVFLGVLGRAWDACWAVLRSALRW
jgi:hypothetical protein